MCCAGVSPFCNPLLSQVDMDTPLPELLKSKPWTSLEDAELEPVLMYVRGRKSLQMPAEFRKIFPTHIEVGPSLQNRVVVNFQDVE